MFWALFEVQPDGGATRMSGQFRDVEIETGRELRAEIRSTLGKYYAADSDRFERDGILFGASAPPGGPELNTFTIHDNVHPIDQLPSFQLNGVAFMQAGFGWAPGHCFCIALMPSPTGAFRPWATSA